MNVTPNIPINTKTKDFNKPVIRVYPYNVSFGETLIITPKNIQRMPQGLIEAYVKYKVATREFLYILKRLGYSKLKIKWSSDTKTPVPPVLKPLLPKIE